MNMITLQWQDSQHFFTPTLDMMLEDDLFLESLKEWLLASSTSKIWELGLSVISFNTLCLQSRKIGKTFGNKVLQICVWNFSKKFMMS